MPPATLPEPNAVPVRRVLEYSLPRGKLVLELQGEPPEWMEPTLKTLGQLLMLPPNWDSYGGRPVDLANVWTAWQLVTATLGDDSPAPAVVPTNRPKWIALPLGQPFGNPFCLAAMKRNAMKRSATKFCPSRR